MEKYNINKKILIKLLVINIVIFLIIWEMNNSTVSNVVYPVNCNRDISYSQKELPLIALCSFPGSGNTWTRSLLQKSTGILTGSIYLDKSLQCGEFPAESVTNSSVLVVKTHHIMLKSEIRNKCKGAIVIVRNATDALLADLSRRSCKGHTCLQDNFDGDIFNTYVEDRFKKWYAYYFKLISEAIISKECNILIVKYENLKVDSQFELYRMLDYLNQPKNGMKCCTGSSNLQNKRKSHSKIKWSPIYKDINVQIKFIYRLIDIYDNACKYPSYNS